MNLRKLELTTGVPWQRSMRRWPRVW